MQSFYNPAQDGPLAKDQSFLMLAFTHLSLSLHCAHYCLKINTLLKYLIFKTNIPPSRTSHLLSTLILPNAQTYGSTCQLCCFFLFVFFSSRYVFVVFSPLSIWTVVDARNLFSSAASRTISSAKAKAGKALQLGSPSSAPASAAYVTLPITLTSVDTMVQARAPISGRGWGEWSFCYHLYGLWLPHLSPFVIKLKKFVLFFSSQ